MFNRATTGVYIVTGLALILTTVLIVTGHAADMDSFQGILMILIGLGAGQYTLGRQIDKTHDVVTKVERATNGALNEKFNELHAKLDAVTGPPNEGGN